MTDQKPHRKPLIYSLTYDKLKIFLHENGAPPFLADQVFNWIYVKKEDSLQNWSNISQKMKVLFQEHFDFHLPEIVWSAESKDLTRKFLVKMRDGEVVEAVVIKGKNRLTLCLSSQVGCAIGCTFCHTGTQGFKRHLEVGEVVGQFMTVNKWLMTHSLSGEHLTNIVYMGQGEPLHNFENIKAATTLFLEEKGLKLSQRKITLSTSGLVPQIKKLIDFPPVNIAISLHAAHDDIRSELMPINKVYDLKRLFEAIASIPLKAHRRITYEYLLIDGMNNRIEDIKALITLLHKKNSKVNLIPFNEYPGSEFKRPSSENIKWFCDELNQRGLICTIRATKGPDILAACGQLKGQKDKLNLWDKKVPSHAFLI